LDDLGNRFGDGNKVAVVFLSKCHICLEILHFTSHLKYDIFSAKKRKTFNSSNQSEHSTNPGSSGRCSYLPVRCIGRLPGPLPLCYRYFLLVDFQDPTARTNEMHFSFGQRVCAFLHGFSHSPDPSVHNLFLCKSHHCWVSTDPRVLSCLLVGGE
jgi:hypothetical protein